MTTGVTLESPTEEFSRRRVGKRAAQVAVVALVVILVLSTVPGLDQVRARFEGASASWLSVALVVEVLSCLAFVVAFRGIFCQRLSWRLSYEIGMTEQGANVILPTGGAGGLALGAWALRRGGMPAERVARRTVAFFVITSSANFGAAVVAGTGVAVGLLPGSGLLWLSIVPAALAALTVGGVLMLPRLLPDRPGAPVGRLRRLLHLSSRAVAGGIEDAVALVRSGNPLVIFGSLGYMAFDVVALAAAFEALGGGAPPAATFVLAYALGQLGGLVPLPGGIGGTDGGLVAVFALYGTSTATAAAAVLAYRVFQLGLPAILGGVAFRHLPRTIARSQSSAADCEPAVAAAG